MDWGTYRTRMVTALQEAVLIGVKGMVIVCLTIWAVSWLLGDYTIVRQRSQNGQAAFEYIQKVVAEQQKAQAAQPKGTP